MHIIIFKTDLDATAVCFHVHTEMGVYIHLAFVNPRFPCEPCSYCAVKETLCSTCVMVGSQHE